MLRAGPKNLRRHSANNRYRNTEYIAQSEKLLRNKNAIELLGVWEQIYNPQSNSPEFEGISRLHLKHLLPANATPASLPAGEPEKARAKRIRLLPPFLVENDSLVLKRRKLHDD